MNMEFSVCYQFAITRRVPWDSEPEVLQGHIEEVSGQLGAHADIGKVVVHTDLARAHTEFEFMAYGTSREAVEDAVREAVAAAIREGGAYHLGVLPKDVEVKHEPKMRAWSGLRTPTWRVRRSSFAFEHAAEEVEAAAS